MLPSSIRCFVPILTQLPGLGWCALSKGWRKLRPRLAEQAERYSSAVCGFAEGGVSGTPSYCGLGDCFAFPSLLYFATTSYAFNMDEKENSFDPSIFGDAVAMQTQWTPILDTEGNLNIYKITTVSNDYIKFKRSMWILICFLTLSLFLLGTIILTGYNIFAFVFFIILMCVTFVYINDYVVFRKNGAEFYKLTKWKDAHIDINNIHALQLVYNDTIDEDHDLDNYELNIVLNSSKRINTVCYRNINKLRKDAAILAKFLNKPLWDATM